MTFMNSMNSMNSMNKKELSFGSSKSTFRRIIIWMRREKNNHDVRVLFKYGIGALIFMCIVYFIQNTVSSFDEEKPTIFVSIASYRDLQCIPTVRDMVRKAEYKERIFVGVYQQHGPNEPDCDSTVRNDTEFELWSAHNYDSIKVHFKEGRGPAVARWWCSQMYRGQTYFLQLDSHTRFLPRWDTLLIEDQRSASKQFGHNRVVLSTYPLGFNENDDSLQDDADRIVMRLCGGSFNGDGVIQPGGAIVDIPEKYVEDPFAAGGFMFAPGSVVSEVPFDSDLPFLFHGEEPMYSMRLWAAGYIITFPRGNYVFHLYGRADAPKIWGDTVWYEHLVASTNRVKRSMLLLDDDGPKAKLGLTPSEAMAYWNHFGFNIYQNRSEKGPLLC